MNHGRWMLSVLSLLTFAHLTTHGAQGDEAKARQLSLPALDQVDMPRWRRFVRPDEKELAFEGIEWLEDFSSGMRASDARQKPLLFWAMNGHPLGCT